MPSCSIGILRGQHQERFLELEGLVADGDLLFLHGFEQRALHLGRRAIDFVGQNQVGEDRPRRVVKPPDCGL